MVRPVGLEPTRLSTADFESAPSASFSTGAYKVPSMLLPATIRLDHEPSCYQQSMLSLHF